MQSAVKDLYFAMLFLNITNSLHECSNAYKVAVTEFCFPSFSLISSDQTYVAINLADDSCYIFRFHKNEIIKPLWL